MSPRGNIWVSATKKGVRKMKKITKILFLCIGIIFLTGCNNLENATVYTTTYPIEYLTKVLYQDHSNIQSIYPDGSDVSTYTLTDKQKETYSKAEIFIYNGTTDEKEIAKDFANSNRKLKVIDAAYSLKYKYGIEELWLNPSNYLMLASNIKDNLEEQIGTKYINEEIEQKYNELKEKLSIMDAEIRSIAKEAQNRGQNTIIASSNVFKFLEDYGFHVLSLEEYENGSASLTTLKNNFNSGTYRYLLVKQNEPTNDMINEITSQTNATVINVHMMNTITEEERKNNADYFTIMEDFISNLKTATNY